MPRGTSRYDEAQLQGRLWTPQILGAAILRAWYDTSDLSTMTLDGSNKCSLLKDKSGNGFNIAQATSGNQPTFSQTALSSAVSGSGALAKPGLTFVSGSDQFLNGTFSASSNSICGFVVFRPVSSGGNNRVISLSANSSTADFGGGNNYIVLLLQNAAGAYSFYASGKAVANFVGPSGPWSPQLFSTINDGVNNTLYSMGTPGTPVALATGTITPGWIGLGADAGNTADGPLDGVISEVLVTVGNAESFRQKIEGYLAWKWGLASGALGLTASHPYKNRPPTIGG